jgi:hypothetical protein
MIVARIERSEIRERPLPDVAPLHPGYGHNSYDRLACPTHRL